MRLRNIIQLWEGSKSCQINLKMAGHKLRELSLDGEGIHHDLAKHSNCDKFSATSSP